MYAQPYPLELSGHPLSPMKSPHRRNIVPHNDDAARVIWWPSRRLHFKQPSACLGDVNVDTPLYCTGWFIWRHGSQTKFIYAFSINRSNAKLIWVEGVIHHHVIIIQHAKYRELSATLHIVVWSVKTFSQNWKGNRYLFCIFFLNISNQHCACWWRNTDGC